MSAPSSSSTPHHQTHRTWTRDGFLISTDPSLLSIPALTDAFSQPWMYWAKPLSAETMAAMIAGSMCFGLFTPTPDAGATDTENTTTTANKTPSDPAQSTSTSSSTEGQQQQPQQIGFARLITDRTTFGYLTDVYVLPGWQNQSLGKWLIACVQEVLESWPNLRRSMLITSKGGKAIAFYEREMGMEVMDGGALSVMTKTGGGWPT